jgi:CheY-like chemotaxis protein
VRSEVGSGSLFWVTLPFAIATTAQVEASAPSAQLLEFGQSAPGTQGENHAVFKSLEAKKKLRVLIAEDNSVNQLIALKMLEKLGHSAVAVTNGREAFDALQIGQFDIVFMDCQMPELDGYEATKLIRSCGTAQICTVPIVAMTANAMAGDREKCISAGMNDYVSKPMKAQDLNLAIERCRTAQDTAHITGGRPAQTLIA